MADDDDEYKQKRERNNLSVQKCRTNDKERMELARVQLEEYKREDQRLQVVQADLKKELQVLKSLFQNAGGGAQQQQQPQQQEHTNLSEN